MHPHTKFGVPSYHGSGDIAHCMYSKMAAILKMRERKKCSFQYTTPSCTYSIQLAIVALCFAMDGRTEKVKTIYLPTFFESADES
jgi:hypothetical protein